jgi:DNA-binding transcriptional regulator GbsR (MarR family)
MKLKDAKDKFIQTWGQLGVNWGICKTMGQIHGLLLTENNPISADDIMERLQISRGNTNINLHSLLDWGLVYKVPKPEGCRKDLYIAEKDMSKVFRQIIKMRKKKELEPMMELTAICSEIEPNCEESTEFCKVVKEIHHFSKRADSALDNLVKLENLWLAGPLMRMFK